MGRRAIGLDPAWGKFGLVVLSTDGERVEVEHHEVAKLGAVPYQPRAIQTAADRLDAALAPWVWPMDGERPTLFIEDFARGAQNRREDAGMLRATVLLGLPPGQVVRTLAISTLKKLATGRGNAEKIEVIRSVEKKWGFTTNDDNEADAYVLAMAGLMTQVPALARLAYERTVLETLAV